MTQTQRAGRSHPLADLLSDLTPSAGVFPVALIEALIDRSVAASARRADQ
ncbi:hypothetical protein [Xinfangfangia pollutisoli]|nr:hypothetical protein [Xinfangfangia pollutisoli]